MIPYSLLAEINEMSRPELIAAKQELIPDKDIPKAERSKLLVAIDSRLSHMKSFEQAINKAKPREYYFASMERDGEKLSVVTTKTLGELILDMEPDVVYGFYKVSKKEFEAMKELGYVEV
jgi:hypothetical protein